MKELKRVTRADLARLLANKIDSSMVKTTKLIEDFSGFVINELIVKGELKLYGLGKFHIVEQAQRNARNPKTGVPLVIPARKTVRFKPSKRLLRAINKKENE